MSMQLYGLLGYPLGHSFSARYFTEKFQRMGLDAQYLNFEYPSVEEALTEMLKHENLKGFNVTIPYKQQMMSYLKGLSPEAEQIGAVNVVKVHRDKESGDVQLWGYNSDVIGFVQSFRSLWNPEVHRKALVLGTGGASKAVLYGLNRLGIETRSVSRKYQPGLWTYDQLTPEIMSEYKVIVNCTPLGMYPHVEGLPCLPYEALTSKHYLFDLVYNPELTAFLERGQQQGAVVQNGLEMLHLQAEAAWDIWTDNAR